MWRGSLLPLGGAAAPGAATAKSVGAAAQPSGSKLPRHGDVFTEDRWAFVKKNRSLQQRLQGNVNPVDAAKGCDLLIFLAACRLKLSAALMQLAHQLRLGLGQAAGLGQFVDAGAHAHQASGLGEGQTGGVALLQLGQFVRQRSNHGA